MANFGVCSVCGCTDLNACFTDGHPCFWVDDTHTLCSACHFPGDFQEIIRTKLLHKEYDTQEDFELDRNVLELEGWTLIGTYSGYDKPFAAKFFRECFEDAPW